MGWLDWMKKRDREVVSGEIAANQTASRTQSKYGGLSDHPPKTEAEVKGDDAFSKMRSVVNNIANDHNSDWHEHWVPFEEAVLGVRKAFAFRVELLLFA
jgi:hypothetical protein